MLKQKQQLRKVTNLKLTTTKMNIDRLNEWYEVQEQLVEIKKRESALRKEVIGDFYPTHKEEGTENVDLDEGYKLSCVFKLNYEFDKNADLEKLREELRATGEDGIAAVEELFKLKIELSTTAYKKLPPSLEKIVKPYITIKEATPSLKIVAPKEK